MWLEKLSLKVADAAKQEKVEKWLRGSGGYEVEMFYGSFMLEFNVSEMNNLATIQKMNMTSFNAQFVYFFQSYITA